jgi:hypothetical protein
MRRSAFCSLTRAIANLKVKDLKLDPEDTVPLAMAKALALEALAGNVNAAAELANRAEGRPRQVVRHEDGEMSSVEALGPEFFAATVRIMIARCEAYGMELPDFLVEAQRLVEAERQAAVDGKAERDVPPPDSSSQEEQ